MHSQELLTLGDLEHSPFPLQVPCKPAARVGSEDSGFFLGVQCFHFLSSAEGSGDPFTCVPACLYRVGNWLMAVCLEGMRGLREKQFAGGGFFQLCGTCLEEHRSLRSPLVWLLDTYLSNLPYGEVHKPTACG